MKVNYFLSAFLIFFFSTGHLKSQDLLVVDAETGDPVANALVEWVEGSRVLFE